MQNHIIIARRKKARKLSREKGWSGRKIARYLSANKNTVNEWLKMDEDEVEKINRGWNGGRRKYSNIQEKRVEKIRRELEEENSYFYGLKVVKRNYIERYGEPISDWFVYDVLKNANMLESHLPTTKGASRYMNYPQKVLAKLGEVVMSADFVGPKYIEGQSKGVNFLSIKYLRPEQIGRIKRVEGQTSDEVIRVFQELWQDYPIPHIVKLDNDSAFGAHLTHKQSIGRVTKLLLYLGASPLYVAPSSPWNNGSVEGYNSVFSKKFWNKLSFGSEQEIDVKIKQFNLEYQKYSRLIDNNPQVPRHKQNFISRPLKVNLNKLTLSDLKTTKIYFLRIVRRKGEKKSEQEKGFINILGKDIFLDRSHINSFVFCQLNLETQNLKIGMQKNDKIKWLKEQKYVIKNVPRS